MGMEVFLLRTINTILPFTHTHTHAHTYTQEHLSRTLRLLLEDQVTDYDIIIERILPFGTHIMVEFYAVNQQSKTYLNSSVAYKMLTENGQDFYFSKFHFLKVDMKGEYTLNVYQYHRSYRLRTQDWKTFT